MEDTDAIPPVSGTTPTVPVVSAKSGNVYEKALIEKYIGMLQSSDTVWYIHGAHYSLLGSYRSKWHGSHHWRRIDQGGADRGESQYVRLLVPIACPSKSLHRRAANASSPSTDPNINPIAYHKPPVRVRRHHAGKSRGQAVIPGCKAGVGECAVQGGRGNEGVGEDHEGEG